MARIYNKTRGPISISVGNQTLRIRGKSWEEVSEDTLRYGGIASALRKGIIAVAPSKLPEVLVPIPSPPPPPECPVEISKVEEAIEEIISTEESSVDKQAEFVPDLIVSESVGPHEDTYITSEVEEKTEENKYETVALEMDSGTKSTKPKKSRTVRTSRTRR